MPWNKKKSYNLLSQKTNSGNLNVGTYTKKTEYVLKRDSKIRLTLTLRFRSYFNKKH